MGVSRPVCADARADSGGSAQTRAALSHAPRVDSEERCGRARRVQAEVLVRARGGGAADAALTLLEVDDLGLDRLDREILSAVCAKFGGGPVGLSTLAIAVGEEADTIEDVYEPYLLQCGLLQRTPRGRAATVRAYEHLGLEAPRAAAPLF